MAANVVTPTINRKTVWGDRRVHDVTLAFDTGDYAAGGIPITAAMLGLNTVDFVLFKGAALEVSATPTASVPRWNAGKIQIFASTTGAPSFLVEHAVGAMGAGATVDVIAVGN